MSSPRVAAVVATYNGERFIERQLTSILDQTQPPDGVVVSDDGSTDRTLEICQRLAQESSVPVTIVRHDGQRPERMGVLELFDRISATVSRGVAAVADTDHIALADQDDVWLPDRLERARAALEGEPRATFTFSDAFLVDDSGRRTGGRLREYAGWPPAWNGLRHEEQFSHALRSPFATGATMVVTRDLVSAALPIPAGWLHDRWFSIVGTAIGRGVLIPEPTIEYCVHGEQMVGLTPLLEPGSRLVQIVRRSQSVTSPARKLVQVRRHIRPLLPSELRPTLAVPGMLRLAADGVVRRGLATRESMPRRAAARAMVRLPRPRVLDLPPPELERRGGELVGAERVAVVAHWADTTQVSRSTARLVDELSGAHYAVVLASTAAGPEPLTWPDGPPSGVTVLRRTNAGYDFGSWAATLDLFPSIAAAPNVLLLNDSMVGPFASLQPVIADFEASPARVWGLTETTQHGRHLQSYLVGFRDGVLTDPGLTAFWRGIRNERDKISIVVRNELGLGALLRRRGLTTAAMFPARSLVGPRQNPTIVGWRQLLDRGVPMVKRQLVTDPRVSTDAVAVAAEINARFGEDVTQWL